MRAERIARVEVRCQACQHFPTHGLCQEWLAERWLFTNSYHCCVGRRIQREKADTEWGSAVYSCVQHRQLMLNKAKGATRFISALHDESSDNEALLEAPTPRPVQLWLLHSRRRRRSHSCNNHGCFANVMRQAYIQKYIVLIKVFYLLMSASECTSSCVTSCRWSHHPCA